MPRRGNKGKRTPKPMVGEVADPLGLGRLLLLYIEWLRVHNYSETTVINRESNLRMLITWLDERDIRKATEVTKQILERYQQYLFNSRKPDGKPLSFVHQMKKLIAAKDLFKWLTRQNYIPSNPASEIELPRAEKRLPRNVLTASEAEAVINSAGVTDPVGIRDRAILETLYSTGMRRMELINLSIYDVYAERGTVFIRQGKGKRDRMIPIGERAVHWIDKYLREVRPQLVVGPDNGRLFLTIDGDGFSGDHLSGLATKYIEKAKIGKKGSCHLFRHTMATLMLEGGADVRYVQEMLGHSSLETTQIYTRVSIRRLKEIHTASHPARLYSSGQESVASGQQDGSGQQSVSSGQEPNDEGGVSTGSGSGRVGSLAALAADPLMIEDSDDYQPTPEELLSSLAAEAADDDLECGDLSPLSFSGEALHHQDQKR